MEKLKFFFLLSFSVIMLNCYAEGKNDILYHCPDYKDITYSVYDLGFFHAQTNYNGLSVKWFSYYPFSERDVKITGFFLAKRQDCLGGRCSIECVYHTTSEKNAFFNIEHDIHSWDVGPGNWQSNWCEANDPNMCQFYLTKDQKTTN